MLKIKEGIDLKELGKFGFEYDGVSCYIKKGYYPVKDDGTRYEDENGFDYIWEIDIIEKNRNLFIEIINNDCSYHNEGNEVDGIVNLIYDLIQARISRENGGVEYERRRDYKKY